MALKFMQLHAAFGANPERVTDLNLGVWALSYLAAPSTPPEAREEVLCRAEAGEEPPRPKVKRIVQQAKAKLQQKDQRRAAPLPPTRRKLAKPGSVGEENSWSSGGAGSSIGAALHDIGELVTGGDAASRSADAY